MKIPEGNEHLIDITRERSERPDWIGPDIKAGQCFIISAGDYRKELLSISIYDIPRADLLKYLPEFPPSSSTRSVLVQVGIEVTMDWQTFGMNGWNKLMSEGQAEVPVWIFNYSKRPVLLEEGDGLVRLYNRFNVSLLRENKLIQYVEAEHVVEEEYGKDWWYLISAGEKLPKAEKNKGVLLCFVVDQIKVWNVASSSEPLRVQKKAELKEFLVSPSREQSSFYVSQTAAKVRVGSCAGELLQNVLTGNLKLTEDTYFQLNSVLVDPYFGRDTPEAEALRVEFFGVPEDPSVQQLVMLQLFEDQ